MASQTQQARVDEVQKQLDELKDVSSKASQERDLSKEQNKKLVELLQRMEKKINDKANREEELEEQNLQLKEMTKLLSTQVEKIERELESKLKKKDARIAELEEQQDFEREESKSSRLTLTKRAGSIQNRYNEDLD